MEDLTTLFKWGGTSLIEIRHQSTPLTFLFDRNCIVCSTLRSARWDSRLTLPVGSVLGLFARKLRVSGQMEASLLSEMLRDGQGEMGVTVKEFIGPLRHALTGERVREDKRRYRIY